MSGGGVNDNTLFYGTVANGGEAEECLRRVRYLRINSKDREDLSTTEPNSYTVKFDNPYKNVESVRMISATLADISLNTEPYLLLSIDELNGRAYSDMQTTDTTGKAIYDILQLSDNFSSGNYVFFRPGLRMFYKPLIDRLDRFTIKIYDQSETLFDFGSDVTSYSLARQNSFVFEIVEVMKNDRRLPRHLVG